MAETFTRTTLEQFDVPKGDYETIFMRAEFGPDAATPLHTHFGFDAAYLLEGDVTVVEHGKPDRQIRAGESWHIKPGAVHQSKAGPRGAKLVVAYVVERGKPLATPWAG